MDNLFEQITNISKASAYDIVVEQVKELKDDNNKLKNALSGLMDEFAEGMEDENNHEAYLIAKELLKK